MNGASVEGDAAKAEAAMRDATRTQPSHKPKNLIVFFRFPKEYQD
jgi:hypothetical protein